MESSNSEIHSNWKNKIKLKNVFAAPRCYGIAVNEASYDGPSVKTAVPGPKSKALLGELNKLQVIDWNLFYYKSLKGPM